MFNDPQFLSRFKFVQAIAEVLQGDSEISELMEGIGFVPTERACQLAAQAVLLTFEAHALGRLSAPSSPPPSAGGGARPRGGGRGKRLPAPGGDTAHCPHCGKPFNPRGLNKHITACKDNPANA